MSDKSMKENAGAHALSLRWLVAACGVAAALCLLAVALDHDLPAPRPATDREAFSGEIAHEFLRNLTSIGPRVAGSYENEVSAVSVVTSWLRRLSQDAGPHNTLDVEVIANSGAFALTFFDGMNMLYRDVRSVLTRVRARGSPPRASPPPKALLVNCHFDTVPDSPGASDDGAGCAVVVGAVRALLASGRPLRRPLLALLNGAEENIMQGSHAATSHSWLKSARVFINLEACGAGGREVVFQWGPHSELLRQYAASAPRPFGGALAQDLFSAGAIPADTDFRVFRDYGNMSGVDLAWARSGYVYHTHLDDISRVSPAVLQRTGDNVLALIRGVIDSTWLDLPPTDVAQPVFFDVLGHSTVLVSARDALLFVGAAVLTNLAMLYVSARQAKRNLYIPRLSWLRSVRWACVCSVAAVLSAILTVASIGVLVHYLGATLPYYRRPWLILPLFALPSLAAAGLSAKYAWSRKDGVTKLLQGVWVSRAFCDGIVSLWTAGLLVGTAFGIRSSVIAWWWSGPWCVLSLIGSLLGGRGAVGGALLGAGLAAAQSMYLSNSVLGALVPLWGRAPPQAAPPNLIMGVVMAALTLANCCWLLPIYMVTKNGHKLCYFILSICGALALLVSLSPLGAAYSAGTPQRLMIFHTTTTVYNSSLLEDGATAPVTVTRYWTPELDVNTRATLETYASHINSTILPYYCNSSLTYCGAPYYLPVKSLVPYGVWATAPAQPNVCTVSSRRRQENSTSTVISLDITGPQHIVILVSPRADATLALIQSGDHTLVPLLDKHHRAYFISLHDKKEANRWNVDLYLQHPPTQSSSSSSDIAQLTVSGHWMASSPRYEGDVVQLRGALPSWTAVTGWPVHSHHFIV